MTHEFNTAEPPVLGEPGETGGIIKIIFPQGTEKEISTPLSLQQLLEAVKEEGVKRFRAYFTPTGGEGGRWLSASDFPLREPGTLHVYPIDKAA